MKRYIITIFFLINFVGNGRAAEIISYIAESEAHEALVRRGIVPYSCLWAGFPREEILRQYHWDHIGAAHRRKKNSKNAGSILEDLFCQGMKATEVPLPDRPYRASSLLYSRHNIHFRRASGKGK